MMEKKIEALIFDWGNTIMIDFDSPGIMKDWDKVELVKGAWDALEALHKQYNMVIATSASHSNTEDMRLALKRVGAERYFQHFFSSRDLGVAKPDPQFFLEISGRLGIDPGNAVSIGDKYPNDIEAAKKAGLMTVWLADDPGHESHSAANAVISSMDLLPKALTLL